MAARATGQRTGGGVATGLSLLLIAWSTLRPGVAPGGLHPVAGVSAFDVVVNALLFVPLGAGLLLLGLRFRMAAGSALLLSVAIELAQLWWIPGRYASPADVASNLVGACAGALLVARWESRARWWPRWAPAIVLLVFAGWIIGGYLAQPAIPGLAPWTAVWAPDPADSLPFDGRVLDARLQRVPLPPGPIPSAPTLRARLMASTAVTLRVTLVSGSPPPAATTLFGVRVGQGTEPFLELVQDGRELRAYVRTGLSWVGLPGPWLRLSEGMPGLAGDTVHLAVEATRKTLRVVSLSGGKERMAELRLTPALYFSSLVNRATGGAFWWGILPAMATFALLGLALASRVWLLLPVGVATVYLGVTGGGCAYPGWPALLLIALGALGGRGLARRLALFARTPPA